MRVWKKIAATLLVAVAVAGCSKKDENSKGVIGISLPSKTEARWVSDGNSMVETLQKLGYQTDVQYAQYEVPTQLSQLENLLVKGVKGLIIAPVDGTTMADLLKQAKEKGITVISYDRLIRNSKNFDYYATFDNYQVGVLQAQSIVDALGLAEGKGPFNIELFAGSNDDNNAHVVYAGGMSVLQPYIDSGKLVVRSGQTRLEQVATLNWDGALAQSRMDNVLSAYYGKAHLDAVLAMNDQIAIGVVSSLRSVGYGNGGAKMPVVTGQDGEIPSIKAIERGDQYSTVFKDTRALAKVASEMMDAALQNRQVDVNDTKSYDNGSKIVPTHLISPQLVDAKNWKQVLVESGYYSEDRLR